MIFLSLTTPDFLHLVFWALAFLGLPLVYAVGKAQERVISLASIGASSPFSRALGGLITISADGGEIAADGIMLGAAILPELSV